ncbi:MAG: hypothetical protein M1820_010926 [Bogoriella megaspora]|nr:MAG: hypothetical protein M1820_010926 [Bogoriella megaspora]
MDRKQSKEKVPSGRVHRTTLSDPNPNETFARYQSAPFRNYSQRNFHNAAFHDVTPMLNNGKGAALQNELANNNTVNEVLDRQKKLEDTLQTVIGGQGGDNPSRGPGAGHPEGHDTVDFDPSAGQSNVGGQKKGPAYSLAGPRGPPPTDQYKGYRDPDYRHFGEEADADRNGRPQPQWGLAKPFPHVSRRRNRGRNMQRRSQPEQKESGHPEGQVGGGPGGHHGSPVRGQPTGETPGGPATKGREQAEEDENGHANFVEHFADTLTGPGQLGLNDSQETLTDATEDYEDEELPNYWFGVRRRFREPLAEWLGTMVAVLVGVCGNLQVKTSGGESGSFSSEAAAWGLGTMMAIYIAGCVSGAHCNPMVSISLSVFRGFPFRKCLVCISAQILGAFCAVFIAYGVYKDAILQVDLQTTATGKNATGTAFFTLPASFATPTTAFFTDFTSAAVMLGTVLALGDDTNAPSGAGMHALIIGLIGFVTASTFGYNTGPQTNPAKDLATRLVPWIVGYGSYMWKDGWWAEAWSAAVAGGLFGCFVYDAAIFEGPESPVNYPRVKRKKARKGTKGKWLKTGLFGKNKKLTAKKDLEDGTIGIIDPRLETKFDGH